MAGLTLVPGRVPLDHWRRLYFGATALVDPSSRAQVERGHRVVSAILSHGEPVYGINTGFGKLASVRIADADLAKLQHNLVVSHFVGVGEALPQPVVRLILSLKIASLAQGASGVRWQAIERLQTCLDRDLLPVIPARGSVGASGDLAPLAHMAAALIGVGPVCFQGRIMPAAAAWQALDQPPLELAAKEGLALLNGTQASTALALAGLFEAERAFEAALATGALATAAAGGSTAPFDPRIHALRRHRGQIDVAHALRRMLDGNGFDPSGRVQDPYCLRCQPQVMGACLDQMRHAAATLAIEANAVSDNPLVLVEDGEVVSGGNFHAEPVAFAADGIALAICEIGSIAERRIAMLLDATISGLPAFLTANPGLNSGLMMPHVTAAALVSENKQQAYPASVDSIPTSANQEDHVSMSAHGARRLGGMAENLVQIVAVELLAAAQGCDFQRPGLAGPALERVRRLLRDRVAHLDDDRPLAPDMAVAAELVRSGALAQAVEKELSPVTLELAPD